MPVAYDLYLHTRQHIFFGTRIVAHGGEQQPATVEGALDSSLKLIVLIRNKTRAQSPTSNKRGCYSGVPSVHADVVDVRIHAQVGGRPLLVHNYVLAVPVLYSRSSISGDGPCFCVCVCMGVGGAPGGLPHARSGSCRRWREHMCGPLSPPHALRSDKQRRSTTRPLPPSTTTTNTQMVFALGQSPPCAPRGADHGVGLQVNSVGVEHAAGGEVLVVQAPPAQVLKLVGPCVSRIVVFRICSSR